MSKLFLPSGYIDIEYLDSRGLPFNIIVGGRGTGKTFSCLQYYIKRDEPIVYMRRTNEEKEYASSEDFTPYKKVCEYMDVDFQITRGKVKKAVNMNTEKIMSYFVGLSSIASVRGFDASDCVSIVYDEFIPEKRSRPIKEEGESFLNAYETINRNRELEGKPAVKAWLLSNSNDIFSPILEELGLLDIALKMERNRTREYINKERGVQMIFLYDSPISQKKSETALYKLAGETYTRMALDNSFRFDDSLCQSRNLREYNPLVTIGEVTVYRHKSRPVYYGTMHRMGDPPLYGTGEKEKARFLSTYGYLFHAFRTGKMEVENMDVYYILEYYFR